MHHVDSYAGCRGAQCSSVVSTPGPPGSAANFPTTTYDASFSCSGDADGRPTLSISTGTDSIARSAYLGVPGLTCLHALSPVASESCDTSFIQGSSQASCKVLRDQR